MIKTIKRFASLMLTISLLAVGLQGCAVFEKTPAADTAAAAERTAYLTCGGCHGPQNIRVAMVMSPNILGQKKGYLAAKLKDFRDNKRIHPYMNGVTSQLTDQDIANLASFYADYGQNHPQ
ncbi:c-type cytochrome [Methylomonas sp. AM2-LC]|uniref:c-type cytochrome n=1 Tax=Methylomonas sp. AM2-LC TaxID=3153301 RepID=UPI003266CE5F